MTSETAPEEPSGTASDAHWARLRADFRAWLHTGAERRWLFLFLVVEVLRALQFKFLWGPMDHVWSDAARHLDNGRHFLTPGPMGCSNPYLYQLFLFLVIKVTHEKPILMNGANLVLCLLYPYVWYRFALLVMKARVNALRFAVFIGVLPTHAVVFQYFFNETMLLPLLGTALWVSASSAKRRSGFLFLVAAFVWTCTILTRSIAVPLSLFTLGYALYRQRSWKLPPFVWRPTLATLAAGIAATGLWIAAQHSLRILEYATPFGDNPTASLYLVSGAKIYETTYTKPKHWSYTYGFSSPSLYVNPFHPFKGYESIRKGTFKYTTNVETHGQDLKDLWWAQLRLNKKIMPRLIFENLVVLAFGHTWPESGLDNTQGLVCLTERWIWLPLTLWAVVGSLWYMIRRRELRFVPALAVFAVAALYGSQLVVMEGRYRKPIEPIVVLAIAWMFDARRLRTQNRLTPA